MHRLLSKSVIFLLFFLLLTTIKTESTFAATFYVSSTGNDSNNGSISAPWKTIQKSIVSVNAGDTVYVRGGTYSEQISITKSGTSASRITFSAYTNETPVIDGGNMGSISNDGLVQIKDGVNYITFNGFTIKGSPDKGLANRGSNNIFTNNKILLSHGSAIWHRFGTNTVFQNNEIYFNVLMNATSSSDNGIVCNTDASWWDAALNSQDSPGAIWQGNYVHDNCGEGIVAHSGDRVVQNTFKDNWSINAYVDNGTGILMDRNFIYETETAYIAIGSGYSYKKIAAGFAVADELSPCATFGNTISNNVAVNVRYGLSFYPYTSCSGIKTTNIINNTFVNYWDYGIRIPGTSAANSGSTIANNIFYSTHGKAMILENPADFKLLNNLWYFAGGNSAGQFLWGSSTYDFNQWNALSSKITGNKWADPQFGYSIPTDPNQYTSGIFALKNTSPAINSGSNGTGYPTFDFLGISRPQGSSYDMGAYEYTGSSIPTPTTIPTTIPTKIGDVNNDGYIDLDDIGVITTNYNASQSVYTKADTNKDGVINVLDIGIVMDYYGK